MRLDTRQHLTGVQPDPQAHPPPAAGLLFHEPANVGLHARRCAHCSFGIVLVGGRCTEDGHDAVAGQLVDPATHVDRGARQRREHAVGDHSHSFRVEVLCPRGEV